MTHCLLLRLLRPQTLVRTIYMQLRGISSHHLGILRKKAPRWALKARSRRWRVLEEQGAGQRLRRWQCARKSPPSFTPCAGEMAEAQMGRKLETVTATRGGLSMQKNVLVL